LSTGVVDAAATSAMMGDWGKAVREESKQEKINRNPARSKETLCEVPAFRLLFFPVRRS
jgi:hypothetical protein